MREQREISETGDQIFYVKVSLGPSIAGQRHGIKKNSYFVWNITVKY